MVSCNKCVKIDVCKFASERLCVGTMVKDTLHECKSFIPRSLVFPLVPYKGFSSYLNADVEEAMFYGKIDGLDDLVTWESDSIEGAQKEFENAVDAYLQLKKEV